MYILFFKFYLILIVTIFVCSMLVCGKICFDLRWGLCTPIIRGIRYPDIYFSHFYTDIYFFVIVEYSAIIENNNNNKWKMSDQKINIKIWDIK